MDTSEDRISYSESVTVDIGDYEKRTVHLSYSSNVREGENAKKALTRARKLVREKLSIYEKRIRQAHDDNIEHEGMDKLSYYDKD